MLHAVLFPGAGIAQHDSLAANITSEVNADSVIAPVDSALRDTASAADSTEIMSAPAESEELQEPAIETRKVRQKVWVFLMFVLVLIIAGLTRSLNLKKHYYLLREVFSLRTSGAEIDIRAGDITFQNILYLFFQCIIIAYTFFSIFDYEGKITFDSGFQAFLFTLITVIGVYTVKFFIYRIITLILNMREMMPVLFAVQSSIGYVFALLAFPVLVLAYYSKSEMTVQYLFLLVAVIGIVYVIYRFVKMLMILSEAFRFPWIYLFLYLCTLEIIPLLVMVNWLGLGWI